MASLGKGLKAGLFSFSENDTIAYISYFLRVMGIKCGNIYRNNFNSFNTFLAKTQKYHYVPMSTILSPYLET